MGAIPYAFSVHHFISTVGADAGFAAIIGLAILILLYFSQARETASLRDWAAESAEHVQELEARLAQLTRAQVSSPVKGTSATTPAPPPPGIVRAGGVPVGAAARAGAGAPVSARTVAPAPATVPAAPAGVGAPALSAATRLIPSADREPISIRAGSGGAVASEERPALDGAAAVMTPAGPPPATAAGAANGSTSPRAPTPAAGGRLPSQSPPRRGDSPAVARPAAVRPAGNGPRRPVMPPGRSGSPSGGRSPISRGVIAVLALLGLIAVVVVVVVVTTSGATNNANTSASTSAAQTAGAKTKQRQTARAGSAVAASSVTVAVLNGTSTPNLAHTVAGRLTAAGFKEGNVVTAPDQTQTATVVGYLPHHRPDALIVARSLKLGSASVQPVDQSNQTVACPPSSTPCSAQVVVTVGSDLAPNT